MPVGRKWVTTDQPSQNGPNRGIPEDSHRPRDPSEAHSQELEDSEKKKKKKIGPNPMRKKKVFWNILRGKKKKNLRGKKNRSGWDEGKPRWRESIRQIKKNENSRVKSGGAVGGEKPPKKKTQGQRTSVHLGKTKDENCRQGLAQKLERNPIKRREKNKPPEKGGWGFVKKSPSFGKRAI